MFFLSATGIVMLLIARVHYSIDILIAYWITTRRELKKNSKV
jgi:hypothetical protein